MLFEFDLMQRHVQALFTHDDRGRLRLVNEPGNAWRFRYDLPEALAERLAVLCRAEPAQGDCAATR